MGTVEFRWDGTPAGVRPVPWVDESTQIVGL